MIGLVFFGGFMLLFFSVMVAVAVTAGRKEYARRKREQAERDQRRFLGMGFLRKAGR